MKLDQRDLQILTLLQTQGRMSSTELAEAVNLSVSPCWKRVRRLEDAGFIRGYRAYLVAADFELIELLVTIALQSHLADDFRAFEAHMKALPEVVDLWAVGGGLDYIARFVSQSLVQYQTLMDQTLDAEVGLHRYYTYVVTKTVKAGQLPITTLIKKPTRDWPNKKKSRSNV